MWPPAHLPPFVSSPPMLPGDGMESGWWGHLPVFKSIRCQLSLQDLDDFVDQATNESLDSDGSSDSDSVNKNQLDLAFGSVIEGRFSKSPGCGIPSDKPSDHSFKKNTGRLDGCEMATNVCPQTVTRPTVLGEATLAIASQPPVLPLTHKSKRIMKTAHLRNRTSSSGDEFMGSDSQCRKKSRPPSRTKQAVKGSVRTAARDLALPITLWPVATNYLSAIATDVDLPATLGPVVTNCLYDTVRDLDLPAKPGPVGTRHLAADSDFAGPQQIHGHGLSNNVLWPEFKKSSVVPLDPKEHDWVVKLASGSWMQVYGLFNEDPQLALRRDFISGYTALHWIAKHGNCQMFENFVSGAEKAGIQLDVDVRSSSGYTALHLAAIHGHVKLIKLLVEKLKVKVTMRDHSGKKAWQYLSSTTTGEVWQLLGAPRGKIIFPVRALPTNPPVGKNPSSRNALTHLSRKTSLAAFLKPQQLRWKSYVRGKIPDLQEVYSD